MKKITLLIGTILLCLPIIAQNNPPTFDLLAVDTIKVTTGQNVILIGNIDDGDSDKIQEIVFTAQSGDETAIIIDSISYTAGNKVALLYFTEKSKTGKVTITIKAQDQENIDAGGSSIVQKTMDVFIDGFNNPGVHYWATNTQHWQAMPFGGAVTAKSQQEYILPETHADNLCTEDFFWGKMWGYITPPEDGLYNFVVYDRMNDGAYFYLSEDATRENLPKKDNPTAVRDYFQERELEWIASDIELVGGKMYYFEAYIREVILAYDLRLEWSGPGVTDGYITSEYLTYDIDQFAPVKTENATLIAAGVNTAAIKWDASFDNNELIGYNIYINGLKNNTYPVKETDYLITGLSAEADYSVVVRAVDSYGNQSKPSDIINFTTWPEDAIAPDVPQNITANSKNGISMLMNWDEVVDNQTTVLGYNMYIDNSTQPVNDGLIYSNSYWLTGLSPHTSYNITVTAVDAGLNESAKSSVYNTSTGNFCATCNEDGIKKGRYSVSLEPLAKNIGIGMHWIIENSSAGALNKVEFPYFEFLDIEKANTNEELKPYKKSLKNATFTVESEDPYQGKYSAKISGSSGAIFNHNGGANLEKGHTYQIIFANKKSPGYNGVIKVKYYNQWVATHVETEIVPTNEWKLDTVEFTVDNDYNAALAYIEFKLSSLGTIYLDNIIFIDKDDNNGTAFTQRTTDLTKDWQPGVLRWGSIHQNDYSFKYNIGINPSYTVTFGDFYNFANSVNAYVAFSTGISDFPDHPSDWYNYPEETVNLFMEYIAGDTSTMGGKIRASEGYIDNFLDNSPGLMIEMGCEVWGGRSETGTNHLSPFAGGKEYGDWARMMAGLFKASPYYDSDKFFFSYSGRNINTLQGWNSDVIEGDHGELDYLDVSGYNGGNLNYDDNVPRSESELGYHKDLINIMLNKIEDAKKYTWADMLKLTGRVMPMYFYETNATDPSYSKTLGQAVNFIDYMGTSQKNGVNWSCIFGLYGSIWAMVENDQQHKNPIYYTGQLFNNHCKGAILDGYMQTNEYITDYNNIKTNYDPVGCYAYNSDTVYSFMFTSRDFSSDYTIQLDLPDEIIFNSDAKMFVFSGEAFNKNAVTIDTIQISNFTDSILVQVPKYSVVYIRATGSSSGINIKDVPWNNIKYKNVESLTLTKTNDITINGDYTDLIVDYQPQDALGSFKWEFFQNDGMNNKYGIGEDNTYLLVGGRTCDDNGKVLVKVSSVDNPELFDTVTVIVSGQGRNCSTSISSEISNDDVQVYPVPSNEYISIEVSTDINHGLIEIYTIEGKKVTSELITSNRFLLDISGFESGVYILTLTIDEKQINKRIIKK